MTYQQRQAGEVTGMVFALIVLYVLAVMTVSFLHVITGRRFRTLRTILRVLVFFLPTPQDQYPARRDRPYAHR